MLFYKEKITKKKTQHIYKYKDIKQKLKILVDLEYTYTEIDKQLVKKEWIKIKLIDKLFKNFNTNRIKNREVMRYTLLELEINRYMDKINVTVTDLNNIDIFLGYDQLIKHNLEVDWNKEIIQFTRCPKKYKTQYQNIVFTSKTRSARIKDSRL